MERKKLVWVGFFLGSSLGGYIPNLWGAGLFSMSGVIFSGLGGLIGIWLAFRLMD